jgi:hypothetical protein
VTLSSRGYEHRFLDCVFLMKTPLGMTRSREKNRSLENTNYHRNVTERDPDRP